MRSRRRIVAPDLTVIRKFLKGKTHRRGKVETRGAKPKWTRANVLAANRARRKSIKGAKGTRYITWNTIVRKSRAPKVHRTTAAKAFVREGVPAKFRPSREKPQRRKEHEEERTLMCGRMRLWPTSKFTDDVDMIIDNKQFQTPTTPEGREHRQQQKVKGQIRTPSEGLEKGFTKPNAQRHRKNVGGYARVCAGVSNCRIVLWEYYTRWGGRAAAAMYKGPIISTLKKKRGIKHRYLLCEDNDPTGYKSGLGIEAKRSLHIRTLPWPRYSPDLMPLDFSLWTHIEIAMEKRAPSGYESVDAYKARLRRVAFRTPQSVVRKAVEAMKKRAQMIFDARGRDIARD